jgi:phage FluMu protein Com
MNQIQFNEILSTELVVHNKRCAHDLYIGRAVGELKASKWANLARLRKQHLPWERLFCLLQFAMHMWRSNLLADVFELKGLALGCWCSPKSCHGHILYDLSVSEHPKRRLQQWIRFLASELLADVDFELTQVWLSSVGLDGRPHIVDAQWHGVMASNILQTPLEPYRIEGGQDPTYMCDLLTYHHKPGDEAPLLKSLLDSKQWCLWYEKDEHTVFYGVRLSTLSWLLLVKKQWLGGSMECTWQCRCSNTFTARWDGANVKCPQCKFVHQSTHLKRQLQRRLKTFDT